MSQFSPLTRGTKTRLPPNVLQTFTDDEWNFSHWYVEEPVTTSHFCNLFLWTWGKLHVAINVTGIKPYDFNSTYYTREGSSFITNYWILKEVCFELSVFSRTNSCKSVGFQHRPGCEKFESEILRKLNICYILVKRNGNVISEIHFLDKNWMWGS